MDLVLYVVIAVAFVVVFYELFQLRREMRAAIRLRAEINALETALWKNGCIPRPKHEDPDEGQPGMRSAWIDLMPAVDLRELRWRFETLREKLGYEFVEKEAHTELRKTKMRRMKK